MPILTNISFIDLKYLIMKKIDLEKILLVSGEGLSPWDCYKIGFALPFSLMTPAASSFLTLAEVCWNDD